MDLYSLWKRRRNLFWKDVLPYLKHVLQSGVGLAISFAFVGGFSIYRSFLERLPADLPIQWIMVFVLAPALYASRFRTYMHRADLVFLRPQWENMKYYAKPVLWRGTAYSSIGLCFLFFVLWPLYIRVDMLHKSFFSTLTVLVCCKWLLSYGKWQEIRMSWLPTARRYAIIRASTAGVMCVLWFFYCEVQTIGMLLLISSVYLLLLQLPQKHIVPWNRLIDNEERQKARLFRMLAWFVNVPTFRQRPRPRKWLGWMGQSLRWGIPYAYRYLLIKTFIRTESIGIVARLCVVGGLLQACMLGDEWRAGVYLLFVWLSGVQLWTLRIYHRDSIWLTLYPMDQQQQNIQFLAFYFRIHLLCAAVLVCPWFVIGKPWTVSFVPLFLGVLFVFVMSRVQFYKQTRGKRHSLF